MGRREESVATLAQAIGFSFCLSEARLRRWPSAIVAATFPCPANCGGPMSLWSMFAPAPGYGQRNEQRRGRHRAAAIAGPGLGKAAAAMASPCCLASQLRANAIVASAGMRFPTARLRPRLRRGRRGLRSPGGWLRPQAMAREGTQEAPFPDAPWRRAAAAPVPLAGGVARRRPRPRLRLRVWVACAQKGQGGRRSKRPRPPWRSSYGRHVSCSRQSRLFRMGVQQGFPDAVLAPIQAIAFGA